VTVTIKRVAGGPLKFSEFMERHGLELEINERPLSLMRNMRMSPDARYYASCKNLEIKDGGCLVGASRSGATPAAAAQAYCIRLQGERLVLNAYKSTRVEFEAPNELTFDLELP
jgi:hypothetical protein